MTLLHSVLIFILYYMFITFFSSTHAFFNHEINRTFIQETFDWRAFLELYPESLSKQINNEEEAINYYLQYHHQQNPYHYPFRFPTLSSFTIAKKKITSYLHLAEQPTQHSLLLPPSINRTLIIYHIGWLITENSFDVTMNNIQLFLNAMIDDSIQIIPKAFYWINLIGGKENPFASAFHFHQYFPNIALLEWNLSPSDMYTHFRTLELLVDERILIADTFPSKTFSNILFLNNEARGPLQQRYYGEWILSFQKLLHYEKNILIGPILSCEGKKPHIQTHTFAIRSNFIQSILEQYRYGTIYKLKYWRNVIKHYEIGLSILAQGINNYTIGSFLYSEKLQQLSFQGKCLAKEKQSGFMIDSNPMRWCKLPLKEVMFMKWGGSPFRKTGFICPVVKLKMENLISSIVNDDKKHYRYLVSNYLPGISKEQFRIVKGEGVEEEYYLQVIERNTFLPLAVKIISPETLRGGFLYDLYKQYDAERVLPEHPLAWTVTASDTKSADKRDYGNAVCFLTNLYGNYPFNLPNKVDLSSKSQSSDNKYWSEEFVLSTMKNEFDLFLQSLNHQSDSNWLIYLFDALVLPSPPTIVADKNATITEHWVENTLNYTEIIRSFLKYVGALQHPRIKILDYPGKTFQSILEVYDIMIEGLIDSNNKGKEIALSCKSVMFTSIFMRYGSEVIANIRAAVSRGSVADNQLELSEITIVPIDSKRFIYQDLSNRILPNWNLHCLHYLSFLTNHPTGFFAQSLPIPEQIDIATVAFPLQSLLEERLFFRNFSNLGYRQSLKSSSFISMDKTIVRNQRYSPYSHLSYDPIYKDLQRAGHFLQYLVRYRRWGYRRLSLNGLSSIMIDSDAPTYCLASGNVWFDHPIVSYASCYTPSQVDRLHVMDLKNGKINFIFDWKEFERNNRMCLRLRKKSYDEAMSRIHSLKKFVSIPKGRDQVHGKEESISSINRDSFSEQSEFNDAMEKTDFDYLDFVVSSEPKKVKKSKRMIAAQTKNITSKNLPRTQARGMLF